MPVRGLLCIVCHGLADDGIPLLVRVFSGCGQIWQDVGAAMPARGLLCGVGNSSSDSGISVRARGLLSGFSNSCAGVGSPAPVRVLLCGFGKTLEVAMPILPFREISNSFG